jgi:hypothetical protein
MKPDTAALDAVVHAINSLQRALGITAIVVAACLALSLLVCATILAKAIEGRHPCAHSCPSCSTESGTAAGATTPDGRPGDASTPACASSATAPRADASTAGTPREMQTTP